MLLFFELTENNNVFFNFLVLEPSEITCPKFELDLDLLSNESSSNSISKISFSYFEKEKLLLFPNISRNNSFFSSEVFFHTKGNPFGNLPLITKGFLSPFSSKILIGISVSFSIFKLGIYGFVIVK